MTSISTLMASTVSGADSPGRVSRGGELQAEIDCSSASVQRTTMTAGFTAKPPSDWAEWSWRGEEAQYRPRLQLINTQALRRQATRPRGTRK